MKQSASTSDQRTLGTIIKKYLACRESSLTLRYVFETRCFIFKGRCWINKNLIFPLYIQPTRIRVRSFQRKGSLLSYRPWRLPQRSYVTDRGKSQTWYKCCGAAYERQLNFSHFQIAQLTQTLCGSPKETPTSVYADILASSEIMRVLLVLLIDPTPQGISAAHTSVVEKYAWESDTLPTRYAFYQILTPLIAIKKYYLCRSTEAIFSVCATYFTMKNVLWVYGYWAYLVK